MYDVKQLDLKTLDAEQWEHLTEPKYRCCLRGQQPDNITNTQIIAIGALHDGKPVGLLLASFFNVVRYAEVHTLFVAENHRRQHLGTQLLSALEPILRPLRCIVVTFVYPAEAPYTLYLEGVLKALSWEGPRPFMTYCKFNGRTFQPSWLRTDFGHSSGFTVFPWSQLTAQERKKIESQLEKGIVPHSVSPFKDEGRIEPINSLGLRHNGDVIGWMITHRDDPDTIRYTALYIHHDYYMSGEAIKLLCESIWRQKKADVPWAILNVNVTLSPPRWLRFLERRLIPYAIEVTHDLNAWKELKREKF